MEKILGLVSGIFWVGMVSAVGGEDYPLREAVEFRARGGMPNVLAKLGKGEEVRIGYFGGSITAAPGWRVQTLEWFRKRFPEAKVEEINGAIGGTGSDLGVFRLRQDVLEAGPDLLFVEFAVNDGGADPVNIQRAMEGMVRQVWGADAETDICFVYTLSQPMLGDMERGKFPRSASAMEEVADHYGIPTVHFGMEVVRRVEEGDLVFQGEGEGADGKAVFSNDGVHPLVESGHVIYTEVLARSVEAMLEVGEPGGHEVGEPLRADHWEAAKMVPLEEKYLKGKWEKADPEVPGVAKNFRNRMPEMWVTEEAGSGIEVRFRGSVVGVYDILGPDGARVSVSIDGGEPKEVARMDGYCTYHRIATLKAGESLDAGAEHTMVVTMLPEPPDRAATLFERNREDLEKNPKKYEGNRWYASAIMLLGEVSE